MVSKEDVLSFLSDFKTKMEIWGIVFFDDRAKNTKTLSLIEISPMIRNKTIKELKLEDYSEGPIQDVVFMGKEMWVFGKIVKQQEIYIKISMGMPNKQTICISFHIAEHPMKYPFKTKK